MKSGRTLKGVGTGQRKLITEREKMEKPDATVSLGKKKKWGESSVRGEQPEKGGLKGKTQEKWFLQNAWPAEDWGDGEKKISLPNTDRRGGPENKAKKQVKG